MITLIRNGQVYGPDPRGEADVLILGEKIARIGRIERAAVEAIGVDVEIIDASGCLVTPGFIDPHEHLHGGSGEDGFSTQTPEIRLEEIVMGGVTTVVGCLGVDTTTKTMAGLLARAKALKEQGISAFLWTGGYSVPPATLLKSAREDIIFIDEVIGAEQVLPLVTTNTARVLKLQTKGTLDTGKDADVLVLRRDSLEIVEVIAGRRRLVTQGRLNVEEPFLKQSTRRFSLRGKKHEDKG